MSTSSTEPSQNMMSNSREHVKLSGTRHSPEHLGVGYTKCSLDPMPSPSSFLCVHGSKDRWFQRNQHSLLPSILSTIFEDTRQWLRHEGAVDRHKDGLHKQLISCTCIREEVLGSKLDGCSLEELVRQVSATHLLTESVTSVCTAGYFMPHTLLTSVCHEF
jgi:hypothetical protein